MRRGTPKFRVASCEAAVASLRSRQPLPCGLAGLAAAPGLLVRVRIEGASRKAAVGLAADGILECRREGGSPSDVRRSVEMRIAALRLARDTYLEEGQSSLTAGALWRTAHPRVLEQGRTAGLDTPSCVSGGSLLEHAIADAVCRLRGLSFFEILKQDLLGIKTSRDLPDAPLESFTCRHTVRPEDPLTVEEIPDGSRVDDSLPQAVEEDIEFYGLHHFKLQLSGDIPKDADRLGRMAVLFNQRCRKGFRVVLDGRGTYENAAPMEELVEILARQPYGDQFLDSVLYIQQPFPQEKALEPEIAGDVARLARIKPVVIDESSGAIDAFDRAVALGYRGVTHRRSMGLFKSLADRSVICRLNEKEESAKYFQTGEGLADLPLLGFQQHLASLAALGVSHFEAGGHRYFRGLDHVPAEEAADALEAHADLYEQRGKSVFLRIEDGVIQAGSLQKPGYGCACEIRFEERTPLAEWSFDRLQAP